MRHTHRNRGFILLVAVVLIPLFGLAVLITTGQTKNLSQQLRLTEMQNEQQDLLLSARAWLDVNRSAVLALEPGQTMDLPVADISSRPAACAVELIEHQENGAALRLTITLQYSGRTAQTTQSLFVPANK